MSLDKQIPHSPDLEEAFIARCLIGPDDAVTSLGLVVPSDFWNPKNQKIVTTIHEIVRDGQVADHLSVLEKLGDEADSAYLSSITASSGFISTPLEEIAKMLQQKTKSRSVIAICDEIKQQAYEGKDDALNGLVSRLLDVENNQPQNTVFNSEQLLKEHSELQDLRFGGLPAGIKYGYTDLDSVTPGARPGDLIVIAGRPSQGKSAFLMNAAINFLKSGKKVLFVSVESSKQELMDRVIGNLSGVGHGRLQNGRLNETELEKVSAAYDEFEKYGLNVIDDPAINTDKIFVQALKLQLKGDLDAIFVDYLQIVNDKTKGEPEHIRVGTISKSLKRIARQLKVPVITAAQLNRQAVTREDQKPKLSDLKDSGQIEQDADMVLALWVENELEKVTNFKILKQRDGRKAIFKLHFNGSSCKFSNHSFISNGRGEG